MICRQPKHVNYIYKADILKVIDGDTFRVKIDLGFGSVRYETMRLVDVNTPEIKGKERDEGLKVREYVKALIEGKTVLLQTFKAKKKYQLKKGKFGRYIADIYLGGKDRQVPLSKHLVKKRMARRVKY